MRTECLKIYSFAELSESAQQNAIESYRETEYGYGYNWQDEWLDSLNTFCELLNIDLGRYEIGPYSYSYIDASYENYNFENEDLKGLRLRTWIINNWLPQLRKGKYYSSGNKWIDGKYHYKSRHSKIQFEYDNCSLTGFCGDNALIDPIIEFVNKPDNRDLNGIISDCMWSFISEFNSDMEYQDSDEYIREIIEANDYEFLADGSMY